MIIQIVQIFYLSKKKFEVNYAYQLEQFLSKFKGIEKEMKLNVNDCVNLIITHYDSL
jgi:hypothetical protein